MEVTAMTWVVALAGLLLIGLLGALQLVAVIRPRSQWTIDNVYGGDPDATDPNAYFAFNQELAWAEPFFWAPLQIAGSIRMLLGERWGFLLAPAAAVPYLYSAITICIWDRDLGSRRNTFGYWAFRCGPRLDCSKESIASSGCWKKEEDDGRGSRSGRRQKAGVRRVGSAGRITAHLLPRVSNQPAGAGLD